MYLGVCRGLAAGSVTEAKSLEIPISVGMGGLSQPGCKTPVLLSDAPAAARGLLRGERRARCWLAKLGFFQWTLSRRVPGVPPLPPGTEKCGVGAWWTFLQRSFSVRNRWGFLFSLFVLNVSKTWMLCCPACRTKACTMEYSCTRGYEKLHHVDLIIVTLVAS